MAGEVSVLKLLEPQKVLGLEMALKLRQSSSSSGALNNCLPNEGFVN